MTEQPRATQGAMTRRALALGAASVAASSALPLPAQAKTSPAYRALQVKGKTTWSESLMVLYFDEQVRNGFSLRISRFPDYDLSWVWLQAMLDGKFVSYADQALRSGAMHNGPDAPNGDYSVPGVTVGASRLGAARDIEEITFHADLGAFQDTVGHNGKGPVRVKLSGSFRPGLLRANSPPGRFERLGSVDAMLQVGNQHRKMSGQAKAHEQSQTKPRFEGPFTYAMLWGKDASLVGLSSPERQYGDVEIGGRDTPLDRIDFERFSPTRRFRGMLAGGGEISGLAHTIVAYEVPVFDRIWNGQIVSAHIGQAEVVGMINDWRPESQVYAAF